MEIKRIIITGGSGFLGKHLGKKLLELGYSVKVIDLKPNDLFETVIADVRDKASMKKEIQDVDLVFHLAGLIEAGESVKFPENFLDFNVNGTLSVLEAMKDNNVKDIIFSSSAAVYGEPISLPIKEDNRTLPISPYGTTKLAMEGLISSYVYSHDFSGVALRYFNLFGPEEHHEPETHVIPRFIDQIFSGKEVTIWGDGKYGRDYLYIDDVVDAHIKAIRLIEKRPKEYHYMNLSSEKSVTVLEIVEYLEKIMNKKVNLKLYPPRPGDPRVLVANAEKAKIEMGWEANTHFEEGLKKTVDYFMQSFEEQSK